MKISFNNFHAPVYARANGRPMYGAYLMPTHCTKEAYSVKRIANVAEK